MKKRTKTTLRTKITLTIVVLLALTGIIYAANPFVFSTFPGLTGVAVSKDELFATGFAGTGFEDVYTLDCMGIPTVYEGSADAEKYLAIAPVQSAAAGFTPRDVFVTYGPFIYRATPPGFFTFFAQVTCSEFDHTGITFDKVGTFGNDMIVTCKDGNVSKIDNLPGGPHVTLLANVNESNGGETEGPVVAPASFGPFGGQILVADEHRGEVNAINNDGPPATVTHNVFNWSGDFGSTAEALVFIPSGTLCTYCGYAFFQASQQSPAGVPSMFAYPPGDFTGLGGSLLVTLEQGQRIDLVQFIAGNYVSSVFDTPPGYNILEGSSIVDCDVPTPTPTSTPFTPTPTPSPSPTATFTPTPTATATATPTAPFTPTPTPTATATATFTPTPSATFTPTPSATFTPTPSATFTPTPSATFTPTPSATFTPTPSATFTPIPSATFTPTPSATFTPTPSATFTPTPSATFTPTPSATFTPIPTATATATFTPTATATATSTPTPTATATFTPTPTPTSTPTFCGLISCTPPYPFVSENPRTNIAFNESEVLRAFRMSSDANCNPQTLQMFYNDEHAMTLGVNQVQVLTSCGTATTLYTISKMLTNPDSAIPPIVGSTIQDGDQAGTDVSERPMFPAVFVTDVTANPGNPLAGDWQYGGTAIPPDATFGTWKGAFRTVDKTQTPNVVIITPGADPAQNHWNLGPGSDPVPPGLIDQGYGNECRWNISSLNLIPGHQYRFYFMVHDGDQNNVGGDVGQDCVYFTMPGTAPTPTPTPTASPTPTPTPTTTPGVIVVISKTFGTTRGGSSKAVTVTFRNDTAVGQVLTGLSITWPQAINGNLQSIKMRATTIFNTSTGGGTLTTSSLLGTTAQRTIAAGECATLTFIFANNVNTIPSSYTGSATFDPFGSVPMLP